MVLLSVDLIIHSQLWNNNIKQKIPKIKNYRFFFNSFKLFFKYSFLPFSPTPPPYPNPPHLPPLFPSPLLYCPCVLYNRSCKPFTLFPYNPLHSFLWSLSACSQFQRLWLYFACLWRVSPSGLKGDINRHVGNCPVGPCGKEL